MLFDRRMPPSLSEQLRVVVWPRVSWERSLRYIVLRLMRIRATPHQLALGFAVGVFASITPLVGLQMAVAGLIAIALRASFTAAMLGTFFGNPVVWAAIWPATYATGTYILGGSGGLAFGQLELQFALLWDSIRQVSPEMFANVWAILWPILKPMLVGSLPVGVAISGVFYFMIWRAAESYQSRRRRRVGYDANYPLGALLASYDPARS